jgi:hypothetical protein
MKEWVIALVPLISAAVGAFLVYLFSSRARREESITRFKEEKYTRLLVKLQGFVGSTTSGQVKREFFEEQYQSWLYASDDVAVLSIEWFASLLTRGAGSPTARPGARLSAKLFLPCAAILRNTNLDYTAFRYIDVLD